MYMHTSNTLLMFSVSQHVCQRLCKGMFGKNLKPTWIECPINLCSIIACYVNSIEIYKEGHKLF